MLEQQHTRVEAGPDDERVGFGGRVGRHGGQERATGLQRRGEPSYLVVATTSGNVTPTVADAIERAGRAPETLGSRVERGTPAIRYAIRIFSF